MRKKAAEILHKEITNVLTTKSKQGFESSLSKIAQLGDILDQMGDSTSADKIDEILKQAGFWSALFSGVSGGGSAAIWDAIKQGKFRESLAVIAKKALIGGASGVVADYLIKWLDGLPIIGAYLKELEGSDKLRSLLEGVVGGAVAESDIANKLVDKSIEAIENLFGWGKKQVEEIKQPAANQSVMPPQTTSVLSTPVTQPSEGTDTQSFQVAAPGTK